nr:hypothetical protein [Fodinibius sp.]NIW96695.1 hypothetical protein [Phycisphaerae bacterium]NIY26360.1 hypothetical protein [Fodinibius sp.]
MSQTDLDQALLELQQGFDQVQFQFTVFHQCTVEVSDPVLGLMEQEDISAQHNIPATINIYYTAQDLVDQNGGAARGLATFSPPHMVWFN